ncbi:metallophosphoesterase [Fusibacter sp. 3D3]|uniref:metallophosphoesterase family protein n=1 Tax=Fusibacter sp. 3D3 TaxID=1048380 RepID=UPI000853E22E|nr:metallophosphoesterase [Fusibacter sp. 3D3]GAU77184.1 DNA double-strand break repair protein Mre11 [Fusibacter sp. 3D3]
MIRLLHIADIHLNTGFASKENVVREQLKEGLVKSFERAIGYVIEEDLDGLILAGDFLDNDKIPFKLEQTILALFEKLFYAEKHLFYATGNHDPMNTTLFLKKFDEEPFFHYFDSDEPKHLQLTMPSGDILEVVGCGHKSKNEKRNLIKQFPRKINDHIWLGIGHSSVPSAFSVGLKEQYMAASLEDIESLKYDYFALGHIHIQQLLSNRIAYSGNLQGLNYKEIGDKGGLLVELMHDDIRVTPKVFNEIQWEAFDFELTEALTTLSELETALLTFVSEQISDIDRSSNRLILRVNLEGRTSLAHGLKETENLDYLSSVIKRKIGLLSVDLKPLSVSTLVDKQFLLNEKTVLSEAISISKHLNENKELLERLLELPIFKATMTYTEKIAEIRRILEVTEEDLIDCFVRGKI